MDSLPTDPLQSRHQALSAEVSHTPCDPVLWVWRGGGCAFGKETAVLYPGPPQDPHGRGNSRGFLNLKHTMLGKEKTQSQKQPQALLVPGLPWARTRESTVKKERGGQVRLLLYLACVTTPGVQPPGFRHPVPSHTW